MAEKPIREFELEDFYAGSPSALTTIYRSYISKVERAVSCYCRRVEAECVVHDVFLNLIERPEVRRQFTGGDMGAWLSTMAKYRAIEALRRSKKWLLLDDPQSLEGHLPPLNDEEGMLHKDQIQCLQKALNRFAAEELPKLGEKLSQVYELRLKDGQPLAFAYLNQSPNAFEYLMIFGVDEQYEVYWFYPAWTDSRTNPMAYPIRPSLKAVELPEQVTHSFAGHWLRIFGVFTKQGDLSVQQVEQAIQGIKRQGLEIKSLEHVPLKDTGQHTILLRVEQP